jgi:hypothetical protein
VRLSEVQHTLDMSLEDMVDELVEARANLKRQEEVVFYVERAVVEAMQDRGASIVKTHAGTARLTTPVSYDYSVLAGLREITSPDDLVGYTPEREVVKREAERWNMTQAKTLANLSHQHRAIIDDAKIYGDPRVKYEAKKGGR